MRGMLAVLAVAMLVAGCGGGDEARQRALDTLSARSSTISPVAAPPYRLEVGELGGKPSDLAAYVDQLYPADQLEAIVAELQQKYSDKPDGYFVRINCTSGGTTEVDNRLANGKFAVGPIGAARTGLDQGHHEFQTLLGKKCPAAPLPTASTPDAVTARQIVDAVIAAGLPAADPRDNSNGICKDMGCVQLITTDDFSVYQFPDVASAQRFAAAFPAGYLNGLIFMRYTEGGSHPTDPAVIPQYNTVLDRVIAEAGP